MDPKNDPRSTAEISGLLEELGQKDVTRRHHARNALMKLGETALPALLDVLAHGGFMARWEAVKTLGEMRLPGSVPGLIDALDDDEQDVRWLAAVALARVGKPALVPLLETLADRPEATYLRQGVHHFLTLYSHPDLHEHLRAVRDALGPFENDADVVPVNQKALEAVRDAD